MNPRLHLVPTPATGGAEREAPAHRGSVAHVSPRGVATPGARARSAHPAYAAARQQPARGSHPVRGARSGLRVLPDEPDRVATAPAADIAQERVERRAVTGSPGRVSAGAPARRGGHLLRTVRRFGNEERGAVTAEYAIVLLAVVER